MEAYLSYKTALYALGVQGLDTIFGEPIDQHSPIHITISASTYWPQKEGYEIHYADMNKLPPKSLLRIGACLVASPAHAFVQMGAELTIERLIMLGYQICAYPKGPNSTPLCTIEDLRQYIKQADNMNGVTQARKALQHIEERSASSMESWSHMKLSLPHRYGGYNIPGIVFNQQVPVSPREAERLGKSCLYIDLCIPELKIGIEYMSKEHHTPDKYQYDFYRTTLLKQKGYRMYWILPHEIYSDQAMEKLAQELIKLLKRRYQNRSKKFADASIALRELLPRHEHSIPRPAPLTPPPALIHPSPQIPASPLWDPEYVKKNILFRSTPE